MLRWGRGLRKQDQVNARAQLAAKVDSPARVEKDAKVDSARPKLPHNERCARFSTCQMEEHLIIYSK